MNREYFQKKNSVQKSLWFEDSEQAEDLLILAAKTQSGSPEKLELLLEAVARSNLAILYFHATETDRD